AVDDGLQFRLVDAIGQELRLVGDEVMEAGTDTGNRRAVVIDHSESKGDGQKQTREIVKMEGVLAARGGERGLRAVPSHKNGCEHAEEVLSHGVEEAEVLCQKIVDRLIQELEKVGLHGLGSF